MPIFIAIKDNPEVYTPYVVSAQTILGRVTVSKPLRTKPGLFSEIDLSKVSVCEEQAEQSGVLLVSLSEADFFTLAFKDSSGLWTKEFAKAELTLDTDKLKKVIEKIVKTDYANHEAWVPVLQRHQEKFSVSMLKKLYVLWDHFPEALKKLTNDQFLRMKKPSSIRSKAFIKSRTLPQLVDLLIKSNQVKGGASGHFRFCLLARLMNIRKLYKPNGLNSVAKTLANCAEVLSEINLPKRDCLATYITEFERQLDNNCEKSFSMEREMSKLMHLDDDKTMDALWLWLLEALEGTSVSASVTYAVLPGHEIDIYRLWDHLFKPLVYKLNLDLPVKVIERHRDRITRFDLVKVLVQDSLDISSWILFCELELDTVIREDLKEKILNKENCIDEVIESTWEKIVEMEEKKYERKTGI